MKKNRLEYSLYVGDTDQGIQLELVMTRRIINELLTSYLPTVLILSIVYATNFFQSFFFEAVVTVNLTSLLVLTTLFISVSSALPPTAYVKMIDIWLIFSQLIPFTEVLLHTFIDCMKKEKQREVNHHGQSILVKTNDLENIADFRKVINSFYSLPLPNFLVSKIPTKLIIYSFFKTRRRNFDPATLGEFAGKVSFPNSIQFCKNFVKCCILNLFKIFEYY